MSLNEVHAGPEPLLGKICSLTFYRYFKGISHFAADLPYQYCLRVGVASYSLHRIYVN